MSRDNESRLYVSEEAETLDIQSIHQKLHELEDSCRKLKINVRLGWDEKVHEYQNKKNLVAINKLREFIDKLKGTCETQKTQIKKTIENETYVIQANMALTNKLAQRDKELVDLQYQLESNFERLALCESLNKKIQRENEMLKEQTAKGNVKEREEIKSLKKELGDLHNQLETKSTEKDSCINVLEEKVKLLQSDSERHKRLIKQIKENKNNLFQENLAFREKLAQHDKEMGDLQVQLEKRIAEKDSYVSVLEEKVRELESNGEMHKRLIQQIQESNNNLLEDNMALRDTLAQQDKDRGELQLQLENNIVEKDHYINVLEEKLRDLENETERHIKLTKHIEETSKNLFQENVSLRGKLVLHDKEIKELQYQLERRMTEKDRFIDVLEDKVKNLEIQPDAPAAESPETKGFFRSFGRRLLGGIRTGLRIGKTVLLLLVTVAVMSAAVGLPSSCDGSLPSRVKDLFLYRLESYYNLQACPLVW